jgi:hypothetical protein
MMTASSANPRSSIGPTYARCSILATNGLALNLEKCVFAVSLLDFLGHRISAAGVAPLRDKVQVILDFPKPTDCKAMQRF